ncbi:MAG: tripartite tricarboxylate transporter TctB family protein [Fretibacterium sp.]|nr:tripartite tricarboxylate transporter TctB family protein [Fretibacterium sp.]
MFELICNVLLWLGLAYTWFFDVLEAPVPTRVARNPYSLQPDVWPKVIIGLLLVCVALNVHRILRKNEDNPDFTLSAFWASARRFLFSKIFLGILIVVGAGLVLEPLGYMATCFLVLFLYGLLLGERRVIRLFLMSALITLLLYVVFSVLLSVNLPRGTIPEMREFALRVELLIAQAKSALGLL